MSKVQNNQEVKDVVIKKPNATKKFDSMLQILIDNIDGLDKNKMTDLIGEHLARNSDSKTKGHKKDPNEPTRARSAYIFMNQDETIKSKVYAKVDKKIEKGEIVAEKNAKGEDKNINKVVHYAREFGKVWAKMTADEKKPFNKMATEDKERYNRECIENGFERKESKKPSVDRSDDTVYITNPESGKRVKRSGKVGKQLVKQLEGDSGNTKAKTPKAKTPKAKTPKAKTPKAKTPKKVEYDTDSDSDSDSD